MKRMWIGLVFTLVFSGHCVAEIFPKRSVTLVVPFAAGGGVDTVARPLADELRKVFNQPVIVENRPGAATNLGTEQVAKADPDGHTLLINLDTVGMYPLLYSRLKYNFATDLAPVAYVASSPMVLVTTPSLGVETLKAFLELAKGKPEALTFAAPGLGTPHHLAFELLSYYAGVQVQTVGYRGGGPALNDVIAGHVNVGVFTLGTALPYIEAGKLTALALTGEKRSELAPQIATLAEQGFPQAQLSNRYVVMAPAKTPQEIISALHQAIVQAVGRPELIDAVRRQGYDVLLTTPVEARAMLRAEFSRWEPIVRETKIQVE